MESALAQLAMEPDTGQLAMETLCEVIRNILAHPAEVEYRRLRLKNAAMQQRVFSVPGGLAFLLALGFESFAGSELLLPPGASLDKLQEARAAIEAAASTDEALPTTCGMLHSGLWNHHLYTIDGELDALRSVINASTRVAVVGSSGNLLYRGHGQHIDEHDVIVRINAASTASFERDVGSRTHIRFGWQQGFFEAQRDHAITPGEILVLTTPNSHMGAPEWERFRKAELGKLGSHHQLVAISNPWAASLRHHLLDDKGEFPSTGFVALAVTLALARSVGAPPVSVLGFGTCPPCGRYFMCSTDHSEAGQSALMLQNNLQLEAEGKDGHHPFAAEGRARETWHRSGVIHLIEELCDEGLWAPGLPMPPMPPMPPMLPMLPPCPPSFPPSFPPVENAERQCWHPCSQANGACPQFCGSDGSCCHLGLSYSPECGFGSIGCQGSACCVRTVAFPVPPGSPPTPGSPPSPPSLPLPPSLPPSPPPCPPSPPPGLPPLSPPYLPYAPARGCDQQLNAYCQSGTCPIAFLPVARLAGGADKDRHDQWRCYDPSTLNAGGDDYSHGIKYCTRNQQLIQVLQRCLVPPPQPKPQPSPPLSPQSPSKQSLSMRATPPTSLGSGRSSSDSSIFSAIFSGGSDSNLAIFLLISMLLPCAASIIVARRLRRTFRTTSAARHESIEIATRSTNVADEEDEGDTTGESGGRQLRLKCVTQALSLWPCGAPGLAILAVSLISLSRYLSAIAAPPPSSSSSPSGPPLATAHSPLPHSPSTPLPLIPSPLLPSSSPLLPPLAPPWKPRRILFVTGLPRSGTTLLEVFLEKHTSDLMIPLASSRADTKEYWPEGGMDYGGSGECLTRFCGQHGYVTQAHRDHVHHNCQAYVERAREVRKSRSDWSDREGELPMAKHPGLTVGIAELAASCEAIGIEPLFIVTVVSPLQWGHGGQRDEDCGGDCRHHIIHSWNRCFEKVDSVRSWDNVMLVRMEDYGQEATWRRVEAFLGLSRINIFFHSGKTAGRRLQGIDGSATAYGADVHGEDETVRAAQRHLIMHGAGSDFTVYTGYLEPICHTMNTIGPEHCEHMLEYGYNCTLGGECETRPLPSWSPLPPSPPPWPISPPPLLQSAIPSETSPSPSPPLPTYCDVHHPLCLHDRTQFEAISVHQSAISRPHDTERRMATCAAFFASASAPLTRFGTFIHIPKNAGTAIEQFLGLSVQGHQAMRRRDVPSGNDHRQPYMVSLRHPIERLLSQYHFFREGRAQHDYAERQLHFCKRGTGVDYDIDCEPKLSPYEFMMLADHPIVEDRHLFGPPGTVNYSSTVPMGTNPSYQFEWLRPHAHSTLNETKDFLLDKFAIIGDVSQLPTFQLMLAKGFGMDMDAAVRSVRESKPENPTEHATVLETFSDSEYADLVQRHAVDVELYYWAVQQVETLKVCYGAAALDEQLCRARDSCT